MADGGKSLPLTEPVIIDCVLCEVVMIEMRDEVVRLVGAVDLEKTDAGLERRIVFRAAMPRITARLLARDLRRLLAQGAH